VNGFIQAFKIMTAGGHSRGCLQIQMRNKRIWS